MVKQARNQQKQAESSACSYALKMAAIFSTEASGCLRPTQCYDPEPRTLNNELIEKIRYRPNGGRNRSVLSRDSVT
jgi:hypothetical protein